jgi:hypothetical protein
MNAQEFEIKLKELDACSPALEWVRLRRRR